MALTRVKGSRLYQLRTFALPVLCWGSRHYSMHGEQHQQQRQVQEFCIWGWCGKKETGVLQQVAGPLLQCSVSAARVQHGMPCTLGAWQAQHAGVNAVTGDKNLIYVTDCKLRPLS